MEINEFAEKVCRAVKKELGEGYRTELKEVRKNNGVILHGILIFSGNQNIVPAIYLDVFWEAYENGASFAGIIRNLLKIYREGVPKRDINMDFFQYFEKVEDRICYRLIRQKGNEELLQECPHVEFLDLAVCFYYAYVGEQLGEGSILIKNSHALRWGAKTADLMRLAKRNTARIFRWECIPMEDVLAEAPEFGSGEDMGLDSGRYISFLAQVPMKILTNSKRMYGAASMLYPGVLESLAAGQQKGFYILPSSVHEVILLPETGKESAGELRRMICDVNCNHVAPEEVLSDNLYYYDYVNKNIRVIY